MYLHTKLETDVVTYYQHYSCQMLFVFPSLSFQTFFIQYISSVVYLDTENCAAQKPHRCPPNSECVNEPGSYRCDCQDGFEKVGATCKGKHRD